MHLPATSARWRCDSGFPVRSSPLGRKSRCLPRSVMLIRLWPKQMIAIMHIDTRSTRRLLQRGSDSTRKSAAFGVTSGPGMATIFATIPGGRSAHHCKAPPGQRRAITGRGIHEAQDSTHRPRRDGSRRSLGNAIDPPGASADLAERQDNDVREIGEHVESDHDDGPEGKR